MKKEYILQAEFSLGKFVGWTIMVTDGSQSFFYPIADDTEYSRLDLLTHVTIGGNVRPIVWRTIYLEGKRKWEAAYKCKYGAWMPLANYLDSTGTGATLREDQALAFLDDKYIPYFDS